MFAGSAVPHTEEVFATPKTHLKCMSCFDKITISFDPDPNIVHKDVIATGCRLDLSVMRTCRQLYEEGHHALWTSNAFCFQDYHSLKSFVAELNSLQRRKINKLHLLLWTNDCSFSTARDAKPLSFSVVDNLPNVRTLYIQLTISCESGRGYYERLAARHAFSAFERLEKLPLMDVRIHIERIDWESEKTLEPITNEKQAKIVSRFRSRLLDPRGAERVKKSREDNKVLSRP